MDQAAPDIQMGGLELGLLVVGGILLLIALVCAIIVCVKMFQKEQTALGIISLILLVCTGIIGSLIILVFGWMKSTEWNMKGLMATYTASLLLGMVLTGAGWGMFIARVATEIQNSPELEQLEPPEIEFE